MAWCLNHVASTGEEVNASLGVANHLTHPMSSGTAQPSCIANVCFYDMYYTMSDTAVYQSDFSIAGNYPWRRVNLWSSYWNAWSQYEMNGSISGTGRNYPNPGGVNTFTVPDLTVIRD